VLQDPQVVGVVRRRVAVLVHVLIGQWEASGMGDIGLADLTAQADRIRPGVLGEWPYQLSEPL